VTPWDISWMPGAGFVVTHCGTQPLCTPEGHAFCPECRQGADVLGFGFVPSVKKGANSPNPEKPWEPISVRETKRSFPCTESSSSDLDGMGVVTQEDAVACLRSGANHDGLTSDTRVAIRALAKKAEKVSEFSSSDDTRAKPDLVFRCVDCRRSFPSERRLLLHHVTCRKRRTKG
jgi:hypothetical protein